MRKFTTYDIETGLIDLNLEMPTLEDALANVPSGQWLIEGHFDADEFYIKDDLPKASPPKPGEWAVFDPIAEEWTDPRSPAELSEELDRARLACVARINFITEGWRKSVATGIFGQETLYSMKEESARRFLLDPDPTETAYPEIYAEVGITADTAENVAQTYAAMGEQFRGALISFEGLRIPSIHAAETAPDQESLDLTLAFFVSQVEGINL